MAYYKDRIGHAVTVGGTGALTLGAAVTKHRAFVVGDDGRKFPGVIEDGDAWETCYLTYTHSGTSVAREFKDSSTGSALNVTTAAKVYVTWIADLATRAILNDVSGSDANTTMAVNTMYVVDMSSWATSDRTYTLPATAAVGDRVGILIQAGDASHELLYTATAGDTLDGVAGGTERSRLFITGEVVIFRCLVANTTWVTENDGRIAQRCVMRLSTTTANETAATWTSPTSISGVWTADLDNASLAATANDRISVRRTANYNLVAEGYSDAGVADQQYFGVVLWKNGVAVLIGTRLATSPKAGANQSPNWSMDVSPLTADDTVNYQFISEAGSLKLRGGAAGVYKSWFSVLEVL